MRSAVYMKILARTNSPLLLGTSSSQAPGLEQCSSGWSVGEDRLTGVHVRNTESSLVVVDIICDLW